MKLIGKILSFSSIFIVFALIISAMLIWPNHPRLKGKFNSGAQDTINYVKSNTNKEYNWEYIEKLYDHSCLEFNGHKITQTIKSFSYIKPNGEKHYTAGSSTTLYFFDFKSINRKRYLLTIPKRFWNIKGFRINEIEFEDSGFWLITNYSILLDFSKEKFVKY
ncbi:hypothetical protein [Desulfosediminicola sp.]|uniref:hypothetical protein n=1 Tax=Desulfosediminicola sp. TaxID=2886825 RepID=UPI003AF304B2